jgi:SAM-dependent methyltransferase
MGCGAGTLAIPFAERVRSVTAVDFSETMIELLTEESTKRGLQTSGPSGQVGRTIGIRPISGFTMWPLPPVPSLWRIFEGLL